MTHTLLLASTNEPRSRAIARELDADGDIVYHAPDTATVLTTLAAHAVDVVLLGPLERYQHSLALLREIRAGEHERVHPGQPVVTLGPIGELDLLRAYDAGSDHHLTVDVSYLLMRAVVRTVARRALEHVTQRHLHVGDLHVDTAAQLASYRGTRMPLCRREYDLLVVFAGDPTRVFSSTHLARAVWGSSDVGQKAVETQVAHLRRRLRAAGAAADELITNRWGRGWALTEPAQAIAAAA
jgi:two-component system response regulator MprA